MDERTGHWFAVLSSRELGKKPVSRTRFGERLVFYRDGAGAPVCMLDQCPHRGAQLSAGRVQDGVIECPFHGFRFEPSGRCVATPSEGDRPISQATRTRVLPVREQDGFVWLYRGPEQSALPEVPALEALRGMFYGEIHTEWPAHFSRALEVQMDYAHLPYIHRTTIGWGMPPAVKVKTEVKGERVRAWMGETEEPVNQHIEVIYPNVWINQVARQASILVACAPVREDRTEVYVRFQQRAVTWPIVREMLSWMGVQMSRIIVQQDLPVVASQLPLDSNDARFERLVAADSPIAAYRRMRRSFLERAQPEGPHALPS